MRKPIGVFGASAPLAGDLPTTARRQNRVPRHVTARIAAALMSAASLLSCSPGKAPQGGGEQLAAPLSHDELNELIDSLANRNEKPRMVAVESSIARLSENPLFADDYDWDEDHRVWSVIREFRKHNSEELWHCLLEHLDDERYVVVYAHERLYAYTESIGTLCRNLARDYLDAPYMMRLPRSMDGNQPAMRLFSPEGVEPWCRDRAGMPLYQQQAELCEAAIKKMQAMPRVPDADKARFTADVKRQIDALLRTEQPYVTKRTMLSDDDGYHFYNAQIAMEIKEKYLAEQNAGKRGAE